MMKMTTIDRAMTEGEIKTEIESRGLTLLYVARIKGGLLGMSKEHFKKGVHAYPQCTVTSFADRNQTEIT